MFKGLRQYTSSSTDSDEHSEKRAAYPSRTVYLLLLLSFLGNALFACQWALLSSAKPYAFLEAGYSPAQHAIQYNTAKFHRGLHDDIPIYEHAASRVPKSELVKMANATWPILNEGGNYVITLDVFHRLCSLDMLRQNLHPGDSYTVRSQVHLQHCVGAIRQALMCSADISPQWSAKYEQAEQRDDILHTCRDLGKIQTWAKEHSTGFLPDLTVYIEG
ncbi:hypothetical protein C8R45DRAFT_1212019 [Mycena sanguinolenta]|nr:hypothetical protein C8R45DRAFT_1212019 [Mycena sanguinolenta]